MPDKSDKSNETSRNQGSRVNACQASSSGANQAINEITKAKKNETPKITAWQVIKGFISYYKPYKLIFFVDLICAIIVACVDLAFPQFLRFCTNDFFTRDSQEILDALLVIAVILIVMYLIKTAAQYFITK